MSTSSDFTAPPSEPRSSTPEWVARLHLATAFLTRLPVPEPCVEAAGSLAQSMAAFPIVGAAVGALASLVFVVAGWLTPPWPAAILTVGALVLLTGALHEDGLADFADGLGARGDAVQRIAVMRDSRTGVFGVLAVVLAVLIPAACLTYAPSGWAGLGAMVAAGALSRAAIPLAMRILPPAAEDGLGAQAGTPDAAVAAQAAIAALVLAAIGIGFGAALVAALAALAAAAMTGWTARRAVGGYTGDVLGAVQKTAEMAAMAAASAFW